MKVYLLKKNDLRWSCMKIFSSCDKFFDNRKNMIFNKKYTRAIFEYHPSYFKLRIRYFPMVNKIPIYRLYDALKQSQRPLVIALKNLAQAHQSYRHHRSYTLVDVKDDHLPYQELIHHETPKYQM